MIGRDQMMDVLLDACPSFRPTWGAFVAEWRDSSDDPPYYLALADFSRHLIAMLERSDTASLPVIFQTVERLQAEGEQYVDEAMVVGLLESLQNGNLHTVTTPEQFRSFLGVRSAAAWDELHRLWRDGPEQRGGCAAGDGGGTSGETAP